MNNMNMISSLDVSCRSVTRQEAEDVSAHTEASGPLLLSSIHTFFFLSLLREIESQSCTFLFSTSYPPFYPNFLYSPSVVGFFSIFFCSLFRHSSFFKLHAPVCKKCCFSVCLILHMYEGNQLESQLWGSSKHSSVWL